MIRVERLGRGDASRVLAAASLFDRPPDKAAVRAYLDDAANFLLLASVDGVPAGFARGMRLRRLDTRRTQLFLYEIGVAPDLRRRGAGAALIRELKALGREEGCVEVFVLTEPGNAAAIALYRSTGGAGEAGLTFVYDLGADA